MKACWNSIEMKTTNNAKSIDCKTLFHSLCLACTSCHAPSLSTLTANTHLCLACRHIFASADFSSSVFDLAVFASPIFASPVIASWSPRHPGHLRGVVVFGDVCCKVTLWLPSILIAPFCFI